MTHLNLLDIMYGFNYPAVTIYDYTHILTAHGSATEEQASWLVHAFFLYFVGAIGMIFNYKNFLVTMMSIELMYLGAVTSFIVYGAASQDPRGSIYALITLIVAACESAVGLGLLIVLYRFGRAIDFNSYQQLGG